MGNEEEVQCFQRSKRIPRIISAITSNLLLIAGGEKDSN